MPAFVANGPDIPEALLQLATDRKGTVTQDHSALHSFLSLWQQLQYAQPSFRCVCHCHIHRHKASPVITASEIDVAEGR